MNMKSTTIKSGDKITNIGERIFTFSVKTVSLCKFLEKNSDVSKSLLSKLLHTGISTGTNLEKAIEHKRKSEHISDINLSIVLKEINEAIFWLRLIMESSDENSNFMQVVKDLREEAIVLSRRLERIAVT